MKYIDATKLIAEIERRIKENEVLPHRYIRLDEDKQLLSFITSLQQEQPSLPSGLDEAAEKYSENILANNEDLQDAIEDAFKAGAEWMEGQGITKEAVIGMATEEIFIKVSEQTLDELDLRPGDKVVVQIRKK